MLTLTVRITPDGTTVAWIGEHGSHRIVRDLDPAVEYALVSTLYRVVDSAYEKGEYIE